MKALPKLSKAQQEAWARILEWYAQEDRDNSFAPLFYAPRRAGKNWRVQGKRATFDALVKKGLLVVAYAWGNAERYTIHPDYLPAASEPAAEPEREGAGDDAPVQKTPRLEFGRVVTILAGEAAGEVGYICGINHTAGTFKVRIEETGYWAMYEAHELEPVTANKPAPADDARPTTDEARLIDSITEARMERDIARNEADSLRGQLEALKAYVGELEQRLKDRGTRINAYEDRMSELEEANIALHNSIVNLEGRNMRLVAEKMRFAELEAENATLSRQLGDVLSVAEELTRRIAEYENARDYNI